MEPTVNHARPQLLRHPKQQRFLCIHTHTDDTSAAPNGLRRDDKRKSEVVKADLLLQRVHALPLLDAQRLRRARRLHLPSPRKHRAVRAGVLVWEGRKLGQKMQRTGSKSRPHDMLYSQVPNS